MRTNDLAIPRDIEALRKHLHGIAPELAASSVEAFSEEIRRSISDARLSEREFEEALIQGASMRIVEDVAFSKLAASLLVRKARREVLKQGLNSFAASVACASDCGLISAPVASFVAKHANALNEMIRFERDSGFEFIGAKTLYDRYLLRHPSTREVLESPQYMFLRVACGLAKDVEEVGELYELMSKLDYLPSTPTLFNSGTSHAQMSSCYLLDSPADNLEAIYRKYLDVALLSKHAGGIGLAFHRVRSRGSLIRGTNGLSNGIVPWLKTLDSSVAAVNQGGKRKGACCVYLETWHADIEDFLELRHNTGDEARRTHNLNLAHWVPDLFMKRVEADGDWSLFDPKVVPSLPDLYGEDFERAYVAAEAKGLEVKKIKARELYSRMMTMLAQTGNGWINFKDASNLKCNQTGRPGRVVHLSNLCTEILEVTDADNTAVCNLGSVNLARHLGANGKFDFEKLARTVRTAVKFLDRVIDINFYPIEAAAKSNNQWRPIGLGVMGLQDLFFRLRLPFDAPEARELSTRIQERVYFEALSASSQLAEAHGRHASFSETRAAEGVLQFDLWKAKTSSELNWAGLREKIKKHGLRNSLLVALAPTATISAIAGCQESIEPQVSNLFKRETLSGEFLQVNLHLARELTSRGLWTAEMREEIKRRNGSVQGIPGVPEDVAHLFRIAWELPMRALLDMAADRAAFIDQSQSLNLFLATPTLEKMSSMYFHAWKLGLKTTYYLRSRPATEIAQVAAKPAPVESCAIDNPNCEVCQ